VERQQAVPGGPDETNSALRQGIGNLTLEAPGVPESEPVGYGLGRLDDRLETLAGLIEHEVQRLADAQR
jgi:hypothetical protein